MSKTGRIAKITVISIMYILIGLFIFRCCFASNRSTLNDLVPTDALSAASADGVIPEMLTHDIVTEISQDGNVACYAFVYIPEIREVQITVRYNSSIYEKESLPTDTVFTFGLTDSDTKEEVPGEILETKTVWMYTYHRLVFRNVSITDTNDLLLQMYAGDKAVAVDVLHYKDQNVVLKPYKLSGGEKKALLG
jgi:hypothetical protein